MKQHFFKYQGTGNDFIIFDDRLRQFPANNVERVKQLCDRRFGIGSDGIILLQKSDEHAFHIDFINPDGSRSFCGNGTRCAIKFAQLLGLVNGVVKFSAIDGEHQAHIDEQGLVHLRMSDVDELMNHKLGTVLDTGSPHLICLVDDVAQVDVPKQGAEIRFNDEFKSDGINVNFAELLSSTAIKLRTYERGVEAETLSCGTGVTAAVIALRNLGLLDEDLVTVQVAGGQLSIKGDKSTDGVYSDIYLIGPAEMVFSGEIDL